MDKLVGLILLILKAINFIVWLWRGNELASQRLEPARTKTKTSISSARIADMDMDIYNI